MSNQSRGTSVRSSRSVRLSKEPPDRLTREVQIDLWEHAAVLYRGFEWHGAAEAFELLANRSELSRKRTKCLLNAGIIRARLGDYIEASELLEKAANQEHSLTITPFLRGLVECKLGNSVKARVCFESCLRALRCECADYSDFGLNYRLDRDSVRRNITSIRTKHNHFPGTEQTQLIGISADLIFEAPPRARPMSEVPLKLPLTVTVPSGKVDKPVQARRRHITRLRTVSSFGAERLLASPIRSGSVGGAPSGAKPEASFKPPTTISAASAKADRPVKALHSQLTRLPTVSSLRRRRERVSQTNSDPASEVSRASPNLRNYSEKSAALKLDGEQCGNRQFASTNQDSPEYDPSKGRPKNSHEPRPAKVQYDSMKPLTTYIQTGGCISPATIVPTPCLDYEGAVLSIEIPSKTASDDQPRSTMLYRMSSREVFRYKIQRKDTLAQELLRRHSSPTSEYAPSLVYDNSPTDTVGTGRSSPRAPELGFYHLPAINEDRDLPTIDSTLELLHATSYALCKAKSTEMNPLPSGSSGVALEDWWDQLVAEHDVSCNSYGNIHTAASSTSNLFISPITTEERTVMARQDAKRMLEGLPALPRPLRLATKSRHQKTKGIADLELPGVPLAMNRFVDCDTSLVTPTTIASSKFFELGRVR